MSKDLNNRQFGDWIVLGFSHIQKTTYGNRYFWLCRCICGKEKPVYQFDLLNGKSKNCGCYRTKLLTKFSTKSGLVPRNNIPAEFRVWSGMKARCYNTKNKRYKNYGGRGISICARWLDKYKGFANFLEDMGPRPSSKYSIERINVNLNYEPENCIWLPKNKQSKNRTTNKITQEIADFIRKEELNKSSKELAKLYNVSIRMINIIKSNRGWK